MLTILKHVAIDAQGRYVAGINEGVAYYTMSVDHAKSFTRDERVPPGCRTRTTRYVEGAMKISEVLRKAREIITDPAKWTTGCLGRSEEGYSLHTWTLGRAVSFCALGAIHAATPYPLSDEERWDAFYSAEAFLKAVVQGPIGPFNDSSTHAEVLDAFDRAITAAEQAEKSDPS